MTTLPAWLGDGPADVARLDVSALDPGLRSGWGVFETLRAHGTATLGRERHLSRLVRGAEGLDIVADLDHLRTALDRTLAAPRSVHEVAIRITLTAGPVNAAAWPPVPVGAPTLVVTLHPAPALPSPATRAVTVTARRWPADIKSTSYVASIMATRQAQAAGARTAVLRDGEELLETAEGNLFAVIDGVLVTPESDGRLLPGVTRELVLEEATRMGLPVRTGPLRSDDIQRAEVVMVSSAVAGLRTLCELDGHALPGAGPGPSPESDRAARTDHSGLHPAVTALREALEALRR